MVQGFYRASLWAWTVSLAGLGEKSDQGETRLPHES